MCVPPIKKSCMQPCIGIIITLFTNTIMNKEDMTSLCGSIPITMYCCYRQNKKGHVEFEIFNMDGFIVEYDATPPNEVMLTEWYG